MSDIEQYVGNRSVEIVTKANPKAEDLLRLRAEVQNASELREIFVNAPKSEWVERLSALTDVGPEAIQYLVDEYDQLGTAGVQVIDPESGKTLMVLSEEDFYQPDDVERVSGNKVQRAPELRPELQGALYMYIHDRERERGIVAKLEELALARGLSHRSIRVATRVGRKGIVSEIDPKGQYDLDFVFHRVSGPAKEFLNLFANPNYNCAQGSYIMREETIEVTYRKGIQDPTTTNLHFDVATGLKASICTKLLREMARKVALTATDAGSLPERLKGEPALWIAPPEGVRAIQRVSKASIFVVEGVPVIALANAKDMGHFTINHYAIKGADAFDRWEVRAKLVFWMCVRNSDVLKYSVELEPVATVLL